jgi:hypothetical protein
MRKLTLAEITLMGTYTYTTADLRATVKLLHEGAFGDLSWVAKCADGDGAKAFADLDSGQIASSKLVLLPSCGLRISSRKAFGLLTNRLPAGPRRGRELQVRLDIIQYRSHMG